MTSTYSAQLDSHASLSPHTLNIYTVLCRVVTWSLLVFVFGLTVYRANTQSIAHDEALTYEWFLEQGVHHMLSFNFNNHVLFTMMAKLFVTVFGVTELTLRAPSLIGCAGYLLAVYLLCRTLFGDSLWLPVSVATLCLNPQILDLTFAARGYILGIACLTASMYVMARALERGTFNAEDPEWRWSCAKSSIFLSLSVAANLTNVLPAASLVLCFYLTASPRLPGHAWPGSYATLRGFGKYLILPGSLLGTFILWPFLIQVRPASFAMGLNKLSDAVQDIFNSSFLYKWTSDIYSSFLDAAPPPPGSWQAKVSDLGVYVLLPLLLVFVAVGLFLMSHTAPETRRKQTLWCQLLGGTAIGSVILIALLHFTLKMSYPFSRYCLYLIPLFTISTLLIARECHFRFPSVPLRILGLFILTAVLCDYAMSLNTKYIRYNAYDAISRDLFLAIETHARSHGLTHVRMGGTWWYEPELNFYRRRYHADWMLPYDVKDRSYFWETPNSLAPADYDYFIFTPASDPELTGSRITTVFRDRATQLTAIAIER